MGKTYRDVDESNAYTNATEEHRVERSLTRQDGTLLESWETTTSEGRTTTIHRTYKGKQVWVEESEMGEPTTRKLMVSKATYQKE